MHLSFKPLPTAVLLAGAMTGAQAQAVEVIEERIATEHHDLRLERIATGLEHPWAMAMLPDGRYLVSERPGRLALIGEDGDITHLTGVPEVNAHGQGGLLDVVLHPRYGDGDHDWIYFTWSRSGDGGTATALGRARLDGEALVEFEELFVQDRHSGPGRHYGSRLAWLDDGTLAMSIGDRGQEPPRAQDKGDHAGSVLRLTETGGAPRDNPFVDDGDALDACTHYAAGHDAVGIVEHGTDCDRARRVIDARRNELDRAHLGQRPPARVHDADADVPALLALERPTCERLQGALQRALHEVGAVEDRDLVVGHAAARERADLQRDLASALSR